jgi:hypothetical protein
MSEEFQETQGSLTFQLNLLNLFAANQASDEAPRREAGKLENMLAELGQSN